MNLWIIYHNTFSYSKMISEIFESELENYFKVSMGNAELVKPSLIIDEKPDFMIFGQLYRQNSLNSVINWIEEFSNLSKSNKISIKKVALYYIVPDNLDASKIGLNQLAKYFPAGSIFSKPLIFKINKFNGSLDNQIYSLIINYVKDLIEFFLNQ